MGLRPSTKLKMKIDYHLHNHFSPDSEEDTRKIVWKASEKGIREICITNHAELHDKRTGKSVFDAREAEQRFKAIKSEIDEIQKEFPEIRIGFGSELEYVEGRMAKLASFVNNTDFDFVLGSVHIVNDVIISSYKYADKFFSKTDECTAYGAYFDLLLKLVRWGHFDAVAHFDINKKYGHKFYGPFKPEKYKDQIIGILTVMAKKGIGLELNTNCIKDKCHEIFPHPAILRWALDAGVSHFTFGSDAHHKKDVGQNFDEAIKIAKEAGIKAISTYTKRKPTIHPIGNF
jgi:histidinol-phosphatase (PHP family)